jgi:hypothetical protein
MNNNRIPLKDQLEGETTDAQVEGGRIGFIFELGTGLGA